MKRMQNGQFGIKSINISLNETGTNHLPIELLVVLSLVLNLFGHCQVWQQLPRCVLRCEAALENERRVEGRPSPRNDHGGFG